MNDKKESTVPSVNSNATSKKSLVSHTHLPKWALFSLNLHSCCDMLEADSNSTARVCSFSQKISSGEKVGDGWKEAWFF